MWKSLFLGSIWFSMLLKVRLRKVSLHHPSVLIYIYNFPWFHLPVIPVACDSVCLWFRLPVIPFACDSICLWFHLSLIPFASDSICLWFHLPVIPFACDSVCLWFRLPVIPFVRSCSYNTFIFVCISFF